MKSTNTVLCVTGRIYHLVFILFGKTNPNVSRYHNMRHLILISLIGTILAGCDKPKEALEKFIFDNNQIVYRDVHKYTFAKNGRIEVDRTTNYQFMAGVAFDSIIYETVFKYNDKGQLISSFDLSDSSRQVKIYNTVDSLVGDYRINGFGDTTYLSSTIYHQNKIIQRVFRHLSRELPDDLKKLKKGDLRNYDTLLFVSDLIYDSNNIHVKTLSRDKTGIVTEEIEHYYEGDRQIKTIKHAFLGDAKYLKETTYYDTGNRPDFVSIGTQGDTIAITKTIEKSNGRIVLNYVKEFDIQDLWYYDTNGQLLAIVMLDRTAQEKTTSTYSYDDKGNKIEEITYRERLNNAH
jgi:YD repeat-containing protein